MDYGRQSYLGYHKGDDRNSTKKAKPLPTQDARNMPEYAGAQTQPQEFPMGKTLYAGGPTPVHRGGSTYPGSQTPFTYQSGTTYYAGGPTPGYGPGEDLSAPDAYHSFNPYLTYRYSPGPHSPHGMDDRPMGFPPRDFSSTYQPRSGRDTMGIAQRGGTDFVGDNPIRVNKRSNRNNMATPPTAVSTSQWEIAEDLKDAWLTHLKKTKGTGTGSKQIGGGGGSRSGSGSGGDK